jgi:hypothetical protein
MDEPVYLPKAVEEMAPDRCPGRGPGVNRLAHPLFSMMGLVTAKRLAEGDVLEAEGRGIDGFTLDLATLQEGVEGRFFNQDFPPFPFAAHTEMREQLILAPSVNKARRNPQPFRDLLDCEHVPVSRPIKPPLPSENAAYFPMRTFLN